MSIRAPHYIYYPSTYNRIKQYVKEPESLTDKIALKSILGIRKMYDKLTFYDPAKMTEDKWLIRCLFLETIAGVPGMVGGMARHLKSLCFLTRDKGRIHHLLEEAENERVHLFFFLRLYQPGIFFRTYIVVAQSLFFAAYMMMYLVSQRFCHRFVGHLE